MESFVQADELRQFIIDNTQNRWTTGERFLGIADRTFWVPSRNNIRDLLASAPVGHHGNQDEIFDCDEYACTLKSRLAFATMSPDIRAITGGRPIAAGIFWGRANWSDDPLHAGNWFITREDELLWIEPQYNNSPAQANGMNPNRGPGHVVTHLRLMLM